MVDASANEHIIPAAEWIQSMLPLLKDGYGLKIHPAGRSMRPFIAGGRDYVILYAAQGETLHRNDVLLYERPDGCLVLHRIHHVDPEGIYCLGDAQVAVEGPIPVDKAYAIAGEIVRKGRSIGCKNRLYRALSEVWMRLRPLRPLVFTLWHTAKGSN